MYGIKTAGALIINYGIFLHVTFDFILAAFVTFMVVKQVNRFRNEAPPAPLAGPMNEEKLLMEISL